MIIKLQAFANGTDNLDFSIESDVDDFGQLNSSADNINKIAPYNYASLETNSYNIDKPRKLYKDEQLSYSNSYLSNFNGYINYLTYIIVEFEEAINFSGITIDSKGIIKEIEVEFYSIVNGKEFIEKRTIENEDVVNFFRTDSENITKVVIAPVRIEPFRFLDIYGIHFGKTFSFAENQIKSPKMIQQKSVSGRELPIDTFDFELIEKPEDLLFDKNQKVEIINEQSITDYVFYVDKAEQKENVTKVNCVDCVSILDELNCDKLLSTENSITGIKTLKDFTDHILSGTNISCSFINGVDENTKIYGLLPETTKRNALIYLSNALGCKIIKQPMLAFTNPTKSNFNFDDSNIFLNSYSQTKETPTKSVKLIKHEFNYFKTTSSGDLEDIYQGQCFAGANSIKFNEFVNAEENLYGEYGNAFDLLANGNLINNENSPRYYDDGVYFELSKDAEVIVRAVYLLDETKTEIYKEIEDAQYYKSYKDEKIETFSLIRYNEQPDYEARAEELLKYYSINETAKAKVLWLTPDINAIVNIYGQKYEIKKLTTSFSDAVEIEVEKIVE